MAVLLLLLLLLLVVVVVVGAGLAPALLLGLDNRILLGNVLVGYGGL
jgi:hypothetical protein